MKVIEKKHREKRVLIKTSRDELYMLFVAIGEPTFVGTRNQDLPISLDWTREEALNFEEKINALYEVHKDTGAELELTEKEVIFLAKRHFERMAELDSIEYPIIVGVDIEDAEQLLHELQRLAYIV